MHILPHDLPAQPGGLALVVVPDGAASKGASSLPSYSNPPPMTAVSTATAFRSSAQSTMGGMPTVAGAPMRSTPMGARRLRSTMALVHWVVPSMAWLISFRSTPDSSRTALTASTMPS